MTDTWRKRLLLIVILCIVTGIAVIAWYYAMPIMKMMRDPQIVRTWAESHGFIGRIIFISGMALQVIIAVIPAGPLEIASGFAYGPIEGALVSTLGIMLGSASAFFLVKCFGNRIIHFFFSSNRINDVKIFQNERSLNRLTFIVFLVPGTPKDLLTYILGLTNMPMGTFLIITTLARIPSILVSTFGGDALVDKDYASAATIFIGVTIVSAIGYYGYYRYNEYKKKKEVSTPQKNKPSNKPSDASS